MVRQKMLEEQKAKEEEEKKKKEAKTPRSTGKLKNKMNMAMFDPTKLRKDGAKELLEQKRKAAESQGGVGGRARGKTMESMVNDTAMKRATVQNGKRRKRGKKRVDISAEVAVEPETEYVAPALSSAPASPKSPKKGGNDPGESSGGCCLIM